MATPNSTVTCGVLLALVIGCAPSEPVSFHADATAPDSADIRTLVTLDARLDTLASVEHGGVILVRAHNHSTRPVAIQYGGCSFEPRAYSNASLSGPVLWALSPAACATALFDISLAGGDSRVFRGLVELPPNALAVGPTYYLSVRLTSIWVTSGTTRISLAREIPAGPVR